MGHQKVRRASDYWAGFCSNFILPLLCNRNGEHFMGQSFQTIAGFGSNGAIIHYRATNETNKNVTKDSLFLLDSGGLYKYEINDILCFLAFCFAKLAKFNAKLFAIETEPAILPEQCTLERQLQSKRTDTPECSKGTLQLRRPSFQIRPQAAYLIRTRGNFCGISV